MSLCVAVVTPEGIVVAGESRQTQIIAGVNRVASDSAIKVFDLTDTVIGATTGWAFMQPPGSPLQRNISSIVEAFKPTIPPNSAVKDVATLLWKHFNDVYQNHITQLPTSAVPPGQIALSLIVAGYEGGSEEGTLYAIEIPSPTPPSAPGRSTITNNGPWWSGQIDVVVRIIRGFDYRVLEFPFIKTALQDPANKTLAAGLEYAILCNNMTLQDAIDFAVAMIEVTITIQKFSSGMVSQPGAIAGWRSDRYCCCATTAEGQMDFT